VGIKRAVHTGLTAWITLILLILATLKTLEILSLQIEWDVDFQEIKMSTIKVNTIDNNGSKVDFPYKINIRGNAIEQGYTASGTEPSSPATGDIWWSTSANKLYQYINAEFKEINLAPPPLWYGSRGIVAGRDYPAQNVIDYFDISGSANSATDFGDLITQRYGGGALSNETRAVFVNGYNTTGPVNLTSMEYVTCATTSNATSFGDNTYGGTGISCWSNGILGGSIGGWTGSASTGAISYLTIATAGNAASAGALGYNTSDHASVNSDTRCITCGGSVSGYVNTMTYFTMDTSVSVADFGDLTQQRAEMGAAEDATRGLIAGGHITGSYYRSEIDYITMATTGNATQSGSLSQSRTQADGAGDGTYACFAGGYTGSGVNTIDRVTVQSLGSASDFGDLTTGGSSTSTTSGKAA
jgi:hypothetical protein